jgi:predicted nuclease of predicted toxin-antitoxin system
MEIKSCLFFADENIQPALIQFLREENFDVISALSEGLVGHSDEEIIQKAFSTNRVVITQDQDFGKMIHTTSVDFIGIIYLRPGHINPSYHIQTLKQLFKEDPELIAPFIVIGSNANNIIRLRIRNQIVR